MRMMVSVARGLMLQSKHLGGLIISRNTVNSYVSAISHSSLRTFAKCQLIGVKVLLRVCHCLLDFIIAAELFL